MHAYRTARTVVGAAVVLALLTAWWWPGLTGQDAQTDVFIIPSPSMIDASEAIDRRLREEGFVTAWDGRIVDECSIPLPSESDWEVLVVGVPEGDICSTRSTIESLKSIRSRFSSATMLAVLPWGMDSEMSVQESLVGELTKIDIRVADARPLIGRPGETQSCLWWDDCPSGGRVATVESFELTEAGRQRLARVIVAGVL